METRISFKNFKENDILTYFHSIEEFENFFEIQFTEDENSKISLFLVNGVKSEKKFQTKDYEFSFDYDESVFLNGAPFTSNPKIKKI